MRHKVLIDGDEIQLGDVFQEAEIGEVAAGIYSVLWRGRSFDARIAGSRVVVDGCAFEADVVDPRELRDSASNSAAHGRAEIVSPMPGKVIRVLVEEGQEVEAGQGILVVEAMKMQNEMASPRKGTVASIRVAAGAAVIAGEVLAAVE